MHPTRSATALVIAATAILTIAASALAVDFGPTRVLRTAAPGVPLMLGDIDAKGQVAVVWQEDRSAGPRSFLRSSDESDETFGPKSALNGGGDALDPQVATCGGSVFAVSNMVTGKYSSEVILDYRTNFPSEGYLSITPGTPMTTFDADIACSDQLVAVAWLDYDPTSSATRVKYYIRLFTDACGGDPCITTVEGDLGSARSSAGLSITATGRRSFAVAFSRGDKMRVQRLIVDDPGGDMTVDASQRRIIVNRSYAVAPFLAADRSDVVLAYHYGGDVRVQISEDRGRTFGSPITVAQGCGIDCDAGYAPSSIDILDGHILAEVTLGSHAGISTRGQVSDDGGETWSETSSHSAGQVGALFRDGDVMVAEAWDQSDSTPMHHKLRYHTGPASSAP